MLRLRVQRVLTGFLVSRFGQHLAMNYLLQSQNDMPFIELDPSQARLWSEQDALDWVGVCGEHGTQRLLHAENLSEDFYNLKTGLAGAILLKFSNYWLKVAAVIPPEKSSQGRFGEMARETNRGQAFRIFSTREAAVDWLVRD